MDQNGCILIYFKRNPYGKIFAYTILYKIDIIYNVATPRQAQNGGLTLQDLFISFILSVLASIVAYYVCKWLDGEK